MAHADDTRSGICYLAMVLVLPALVGCPVEEVDEMPEVTPEVVAYYPLDGSAEDEGDHQLDGEVEGAQPIEDRHGEDDGALFFDGEDDRVSIGDISTFDFGEDFTVEAWLYLESMVDEHGLVSQNDGDSPTDGWVWTANSTGGLSFTMHATTHRLDFGPIELRTWHHVAAVKFGSTSHLYIDGTLRSSYDGWTTLQESSAPVQLGMKGSSDGDPHLHGALDELVFWYGALSDEEVAERAEP
jgi:hypothetical protein